MKKYNLYFMLTVLLAGLFASCSREDMDGPQTNEPTSVTLSASVDRSIQTRAGTIPDQYKLRYILEVWTTGDSPVLKYREEQIKADFSGVDFTFGLTDAGNYNALLWADFLHNNYTSTTSKVTISGFECDHYTDHNYKTTDNLKNITRTPGGNAPYQGFDAFCACHPISKTTGAYSDNVQLVRPFGQINIIEKDADALNKVDQTNAVFKVPKGYNIENGMPTSTTEEARMCIATIMWAAYHDCTANLYYDYIFAPSTGQTTLGEIALSFEVPENMKNTYQIADFTIPANMPVVRNKRTNISGHIVSVSDAPSNNAKLSVTISDGWSDDQIEKDVDPKVGDYYYKDGTWSTENKATVANPVIGVVYKVNADGGGKVVSHTEPTLAWTTDGNEATTGATSGPDGKANTEKIFAGVAAGTYSLDNYPIFKACKELRTSTGNDGWYILSMDQIDDLLYAIDDINDKITAISGGIAIVLPTSDFNGYWTSREAKNNNTIAWVANGLRSGGTVTKTAEHRVRFVLDF